MMLVIMVVTDTIDITASVSVSAAITSARVAHHHCNNTWNTQSFCNIRSKCTDCVCILYTLPVKFVFKSGVTKNCLVVY